MQENVVIPVLVDSSDSDSKVPKVQVKKHCHQTAAAAACDQNESTTPKLDSFKLKMMDNPQEKRVKFSGDLNLPAEPVISPENESNKRFGPIWFSLVASEQK